MFPILIYVQKATKNFIFKSAFSNSQCKTFLCQGKHNHSSVLIVKYMLLPASNKFLTTLPINRPELSFSFMTTENTARTWKASWIFNPLSTHILFMCKMSLLLPAVFRFHFHFYCVHKKNLKKANWTRYIHVTFLQSFFRAEPVARPDNFT